VEKGEMEMKRNYLLLFVLIGIAIAIVLSSVVYGTEDSIVRRSQKGQIHTYYIAADEVEWNYAPAGVNQTTGEPFGDVENVFVQNGPDRIGSVYIKAQYREYTDASFTTLKSIPAQWQHLGNLGPIIRAEVGDTIRIVFKNNTNFPQSMHPHGVFYEKDSEGVPYDDGTGGSDKDDDAVPPGDMHTYTWEVPTRAGPGKRDPSSILWMYHGHVDEPADTNAGLIGPIIITRKGRARSDGTPKDVDREFVTLFTVFDENASLYLDDNIATYPTNPGLVDPEEDGFIESNLMHSINGYVYGNLPLEAMTMRRGERVRWYVAAMGTEVDLHTPHWHGNTGIMNGTRVDVVELLPLSMKVVDMFPDDPGTWMYHCHVNDHIIAGMMARYHVNP